nr:uncharacterized mitochondrial protein AtMg00810-like [Tanacetum cinerariifolium]
MVPLNNLGPDLAGKPVNETSYRGMIGSLIYLTEIRPDIQFSTILCARYQSNPKESHLTTMKRILRYLKGTLTLGLYHSKCPGFDLKGYPDSDYAGCNMDRKSTSEAEYVVAVGCCASILWMKSQLSDYDIHYKMVPIFYDNTSASSISNNPSNNVVSSFNYPLNVSVYKPIMKFLQNCPLYNAFTNYPSVVYQNFFREFWSTTVAFDHFSSTDEPEKCPLKKFLIKFLVLNGQRPLTLNFNTFCSSTGLNYNNGNYVDHPTPKVVKKELGKITINPSYLNKTSVLKNSFPVAWRILFTFVILVLGGNYSSNEQVNFIKALRLQEHSLRRPKSKKPPTKTKGTIAPPKDSMGTKQPIDREPTFTTSDEGTTKTTSRSEGSIGDNDSEGNIPPADMEPIHTTVVAPSGTTAKYQDKLDNESNEEEVLTVGDEMDEDTQADDEVGTPPKQDQPEQTPVQESTFDSSPDLKKFDNILPLTERQLIKYLRKISRLQDQTDKRVESSMSSLNKSSSTTSDLYKGLEVITQLLKDITNSVKDNPATNKKIKEATKTLAKISTQTTEILSLTALKQEVSSLRQDTSEIKSMMSEMYAAFKVNIERKNATHTATEEPPSHTEGETGANRQEKVDEPKEGKGIANNDQAEDQRKLVKASSIVCPDLDKPPKVIKVVREEAKMLGIRPKEAITTKAAEVFKKAHDAKHAIFKRKHTEKIKKSLELRKHKYDSYMWAVNSRLKPEPIIDIKIHPKTKPIIIIVYRGNDGRNFDVHNPFLFREFGISELDEMRKIIPKKKIAVVKNLMNSLSRRKRKHMELEPKVKILGLECNRAPFKNVLFVNNMVIKEPEYRILFTDEFGGQAFQRWNDIHKVRMEALVSCLVAASMVKSLENARFSMKLRKLIVEHPDQEKLKLKKVNL